MNEKLDIALRQSEGIAKRFTETYNIIKDVFSEYTNEELEHMMYWNFNNPIITRDMQVLRDIIDDIKSERIMRN